MKAVLFVFVLMLVLLVLSGCRTGMAIHPTMKVGKEATVREVTMATTIYAEKLEMVFSKEVPFDIARGARAAVMPGSNASGGDVAVPPPPAPAVKKPATKSATAKEK